MQVQLASWASPAERDFRFPNLKPYSLRGGGKKGEQLNNQVAHLIANWVSPQSRDGQSGPDVHRKSRNNRQSSLIDQSRIALWNSPTSPTVKDKHQAGNNRFVTHVSKLLSTSTSGPTSPSSPVSTESTAVLNPEFTRWLLAFPPGWESYAGMETL
jgi:hypothetical protein